MATTWYCTSNTNLRNIIELIRVIENLLILVVIKLVTKIHFSKDISLFNINLFLYVMRIIRIIYKSI